jgi:hypothetical protein
MNTSLPNGGPVPYIKRGAFSLPNYLNVDTRLSKSITVHERFNFEIRAELFNTFNSTIIQAVDANAVTYAAPGAAGCPAASHTNECMTPVSSFQQVKTTSGSLLGARQAQFGFRFAF